MKTRKILFASFLILLIAIPGKLKAQDTDLLLETIGVLSAQGLYLTYVSIGTLADGHANGNYDNDFTIQALQEYQNLAIVSRDQLKKLLTSPSIKGEDIIFIDDLISTLELLRGEAEGYSKYLETGSEEYIKIYDKKRTDAWDKITVLLDLK